MSATIAGAKCCPQKINGADQEGSNQYEYNDLPIAGLGNPTIFEANSVDFCFHS